MAPPKLDPNRRLRDKTDETPSGSSRIFIVRVDITIAPGRAAEFMPLMAAQARNSLSTEPACHQFDICIDPDDPEQVMLYEVYDNRAAFDTHLASDHFAAFDAAAGPLMAAKTARFFERSEP